MNMTHLSNNEVALALNIDPSLVSRFRTGKRVPSPSSGYIEALSDFLASHIKQEYQKAALAELFGTTYRPQDDPSDFFSPLLLQFLNDQNTIDSESIGMFIRGIGLWSVNKSHATSEVRYRWNGEAITGKETLSGPQGLREGIIRILTRVEASEAERKHLYLFSEESMEWMNDHLDPKGFWQDLLASCISSGCRITVIHTLTRSSGELNDAVRKWFPVYMTGAIESFVLPSKGVKLFDHTLILFNDECALHSTSPHTYALDDRSYTLTGELEDTLTLRKQFDHLLQACTPLLRSTPLAHREEYYRAVEHMLDHNPEEIIATELLFSLFIPSSLYSHILLRNHVPLKEISHLCAMQEKLEKKALAYLEDSEMKIIFTLPRVTDVVKARVPFTFIPFSHIQETTYLPSEYHSHLAYVMGVLRSYPNLQVVLTGRKKFSEGVQIICDPCRKMSVIKEDTPTLLFYSQEPDFTQAMHGFLFNEFALRERKWKNSQQILEKLEEYSDKIMRKMTGRMLP